ncbi:hypothetical protein A3862_16185 [Methylobacterium sp. XJLW]|nr:hypothetical protein A3862_16185 [Methylobacterium sp. XJLW]
MRPVAALFRERFRDDLPEIYTVLRKSDGLPKLLRLLKPMVEEDLKARREAAEAARIEAEKAKMLADAERRLREQAERDAKRKAKAAQTEGAEA